MSPEIECLLGEMLGQLRPRMGRPTTYQQASETISLLESRLVRDVRNGEVYAHDLVHRAVNVYALGGENEVELQVDGEEGVDTDGEDEGAEEAEVNATDLELADVERQLEELRAEEEGAAMGQMEDNEEQLPYVPRCVNIVTQEQEEDFGKMLHAVVSDTKRMTSKISGNHLGGLAGILKPRTAHGSTFIRASDAEGGSLNSDCQPSAVPLRMLRRGVKHNKLETEQIFVPMEDMLARTVIRADERANEERQRLKRQILTMAS